ncbi:MAG: hypothetical protein AB201_02255 [Parcubacteria bacterium C7867-006]|nr:MAG: hypothetical protein AB201_02255 [Parcubacteria bacterium C7867-006]
MRIAGRPAILIISPPFARLNFLVPTNKFGLDGVHNATIANSPHWHNKHSLRALVIRVDPHLLFPLSLNLDSGSRIPNTDPDELSQALSVNRDVVGKSNNHKVS